MHRTRTIFKQKRHDALSDYLSFACGTSRAMKNTTQFYIRNIRSGLLKSPEERTHNEVKVLHDVFTGIQKANIKRAEKRRAGMKDILSEPCTVKRYCMLKKLIKDTAPYEYPTMHKWFLSYEVLDAVFKNTKNPVYYGMPSQLNQNCIKKVAKEWESYFKSLKAYAKNPSSFTGRPKAPGYIRKDETTAWFTNQIAKLKLVGDFYVLVFTCTKETLRVAKASTPIPGKYIKTEVKPAYDGYSILITTETKSDDIEEPKNPTRIMGIDPGVDNFLAVTTNTGARPFLVSGGAIKSINQYFNKERARLTSELTKGKSSAESQKDSKRLTALSRKRDNRLRDFFYKVAHLVCRFAKQENIEVILMGHNNRQKDEVSLGKRNNQTFVNIPFSQFIGVMRTVSEKYGIFFKTREESYTSKASMLDNDEIPTYRNNGSSNNNKKQEELSFSGKRTKRGLYHSKDGILINADINGAANLIRKEYPDAFKDLEGLSYLYTTVEVKGYRDIYANIPKKAKPDIFRERGGKRLLSDSRKKHHDNWKKKTAARMCNGFKKVS